MALPEAQAIGRFEAFPISENAGDKVLVAIFVAVHYNHGDDKSKERGTRRLATLYRMIDDRIRASECQDSIFVLDGEWADTDAARL